MKVIYGDHVVVWEHNKYFSHITEMLLHLYDKEEWKDTLFVLGSYIHYNHSFFQKKFPDHNIIVYQLEQLVGNKTSWNNLANILTNLATFETVWDMDYLNVDYLEQYSKIKVEKILPVTYTPQIKNHRITNNYTDIDVLFYGFMSERRGRVFKKLNQQLYKESHGLSIVILYGGDTILQDELISRSKIILNIHGHEPWFRQEQPRIFYPLVNNKLVISETSQYNYFGDCIVEADIDNISKTLTDLIVNDKWKELAETNGKKFKENEYDLIRNWS